MRAVVGWEMDIGDAGMVERTRLRDGDDEDDGEVGDLGESIRRTDDVCGGSPFPPTVQGRAEESAQLLSDGQYRQRPIRTWQPLPAFAVD